MKKSAKLSLLMAGLYVVITLILLSVMPSLLGPKWGALPAIVYILAIASFASPIIAYIVIPIIEKLEERGE